ncbi:MAG: PAS domain S-box-containing protein, partial [Halioglobus sp.]
MFTREPEGPKGLYRSLYKLFFNEKSAVIIAIGIVWLVGLSASESFESRVRQEVDDALQSELHSATYAIDVWRKVQIRVTQSYAGTEQLVDLTQQLLIAASDREPLRQSVAQSALRKLFTEARGQQLVTEFFILAPDNTYLAASSDEYIGADNILTSKPETLKRLWSGEIPLAPLAGDNDSPGSESDEAVRQRVSILFAAPIRNLENQVIALLLLRKSPFDHVVALLQSSSFSQTGRMFGFDKGGRALSLLQFQEKSSDNQIIAHPDGGDMPVIIRVQNSGALQKGGKNLDGYADHRGVSVVAAWQWLPDAGMGIAALQDEAEAFSDYYYVRNIAYARGGLVSLLIVALYFLFQNRERALTKARTRLDAVYRTSVDCHIIIDTQGIIYSFNPTTERMFGYSAEQLRGQNISLLMPEPHGSEHDGYLAPFFAAEKHTQQFAQALTINRETEGLRKDGTVFSIDIHVTALKLDGKDYFAGIIRNISERKRNEQQIQEKDRRLQRILRHAQYGTWEWRIGTTHVDCDSEVSSTLGLAEDSTPSRMNLLSFLHGDDCRSLQSDFFTCLRTEQEFNTECRVVRGNGTLGWVLMQGSIKRDEAGKPTHLQGLVRDVTERKEMEKRLRASELALQESEGHLNNILNTAPALISIKDLDGRYTFANPACTRLTGKTLQDYIGATDDDLFSPDVARFINQFNKLIIEEGKELQKEWSFEQGSKNIWLMTSLFPLSDSAGKVYAVGSFSID